MNPALGFFKRKSTMLPKFRKQLQITARFGAIIGVLVLLGALLTELVSSYDWIQARSERTLEKQATEFLAKGVDPTDSDVEWLWRMDHGTSMSAELFRRTKDEIIEQRTACQSLIKKHATIIDKTVTSIDPDGIPDLTKTPCFLIDTSVRPSIWKSVNISKVISNSIVAATLISIVTFSALWVLGYPHLGWRRLSVAAAILLGACGGIVQWFSNQDIPLAILAAVIGIVLIGPLILGGRELYLWVAKGFNTGR